jgi:hypothetical protein
MKHVPFNRRALSALLTALLLGFSTAPALATCGTGNAPSYDDISAVLLAQNGCHSSVQDPAEDRRLYPVTDVRCSTFWALFWELQRPIARYSQFNMQGSVGTFALSSTFADARAVLKRDDFFSLSPPDYIVTDSAELSLTVKRCGVVTKILLYDGSPRVLEPAALKAYKDLRALVFESQKTLISAKPSLFPYGGLFFDYP